MCICICNIFYMHKLTRIEINWRNPCGATNKTHRQWERWGSYFCRSLGSFNRMLAYSFVPSKHFDSSCFSSFFHSSVASSQFYDSPLLPLNYRAVIQWLLQWPHKKNITKKCSQFKVTNFDRYSSRAMSFVLVLLVCWYYYHTHYTYSGTTTLYNIASRKVQIKKLFS